METFVFAGERLVNLHNVSSISFIEDQQRIAFNMNYDVTIKRVPDRTVCAYVYWHPNNFQKSIKELSEVKYVYDNFIYCPSGLINKNEISSIKFDEINQRVIFNMRHSVDINRDDLIRTAGVVFAEFVEYDKYVTYIDYVVSELTAPELTTLEIE